MKRHVAMRRLVCSLSVSIFRYNYCYKCYLSNMRCDVLGKLKSRFKLLHDEISQRHKRNLIRVTFKIYTERLWMCSLRDFDASGFVRYNFFYAEFFVEQSSRRYMKRCNSICRVALFFVIWMSRWIFSLVRLR